MKMDSLLHNLDSHDKNVLWVFGYGSLMWNPNFNFQKQLTGHINGFVRRFWQGNTTHRGTPAKPGRVATLTKQQQGCVWGIAFQIVGVTQIKETLDNLFTREAVLGGYEAFITKFYTKGSNGPPMNVLVFTATSSSYLFLGPADTNVMAQQIFNTSGQAGSNIEYVTNIADYVRKHIPEDNDDHLFSLDQALRRLATKSGNTSSQKCDCKVPKPQLGYRYNIANIHTDHLSSSRNDCISKPDYSVPMDHYKGISINLLSKTNLKQQHVGTSTEIHVNIELPHLQTTQA